MSEFSSTGNTMDSLRDLVQYGWEKIAFYGGSFFPMHPGHMEIAEAAVREFVDAVVFCPHTHNPNKNIPYAALEGNMAIIHLYIKNSKYRKQLLVANPQTLLHGIQNTEFLRLAQDLSNVGVSAYILIGADAIKQGYPPFLRRLPHILAPRIGVEMRADEILTGEYHVLRRLSILTRRRRSSDLRQIMGTDFDLLSSSTLQDLLGEEYRFDVAKHDSEIESLKRILDLKEDETVASRNEYYRNACKAKDFDIPHSYRAALSKLGLVYAAIERLDLAEECILNSAYRADDPEIRLNAGVFYLFKYDAELDTAIAYLALACRLQARIVYRCEGILNSFLIQRERHYPTALLEPYFERWEELRRNGFTF